MNHPATLKQTLTEHNAAKRLNIPNHVGITTREITNHV